MTSTPSGTSSSPTAGTTESGSPPSSVDAQLAAAEAELDRFEAALGVPGVAEDEVTAEARRVLALPPAALRRMTAAQCGEAAYALGQYGHRLQQAVNREQARATWAAERVKRAIAKTVGRYAGVSFEERRLQAVAGDDVASRLDAVRVRSQLRLDRVSFLAGKASELARTLVALMTAKRGEPRD